MDGVLKLVAAVLAQLAVAEREPKIAWRALVVGGIGMLSAACIAAAVGCAVSALWLAMRDVAGPIWAPLIAGAALLALALALYTLAYRFFFWTRRRQRATASVEIASAEIGRFVAANKGSLLLAAFVAGVISANNAPGR